MPIGSDRPIHLEPVINGRSSIRRAVVLRTGLVLVTAALTFGSMSVAFAEKPDTPPGQDAPGCQGNNDQACGYDPQLDHGKDCQHSEDHTCDSLGGSHP